MFTKFITTVGFLAILSPAICQSKKDSLGLPGDNFDLYGAMELFKKSSSPEAFEKALNSSDNEINNLDLDADGKVDYIKVVDKTENNVHSIIMQVAVSKDELQDVAVIEVEKTGNDQAHIQIVGDEELYGKNYIIEPAPETKTGKEALATDSNADDVYKSGSDQSADNSSNNNSPAAGGNSGSGGNTTVINVWGWPSVQYIYGPSYMAYSSPWYWGYYPGWWQPWYPVYWGVYYCRAYHYHYPYYRRAYSYRSPAANNYYYGHRSVSNSVIQYNRNGYYNQRQQAYRANVQPGRRYNAQPAGPRGGSQVSREQKTLNNQPANQNRARQRSAQPARSNSNAAPRQNTVQKQNAAPKQTAAPRRNNTPQQHAAPQQNAVPKQNSNPHGGSVQRQSNPRPQQQQMSQPQQRQQSAPQHIGGGGNKGGGSPSMGRGGGGSPAHGGGGRR